MRPIFSPEGGALLRKFASQRLLLAFDFDGTLSPITTEPDAATIRPATKKLLRELTLKYPCIVVSGRSREDVRRRLHGIRFAEVIGNHGIEPWDSTRDGAETVRRWIPILTQQLKELPGIYLEDKGFSVSVHYRKEQQKRRAARMIGRVCRSLSHARILGGKNVINVLPRNAPNKGLAVEEERRRRHCEYVIYAGDDKTDEDAFALAESKKFLGVRVGKKRDSLAGFYIKNQREIDRLLKALITLRV